MRRARLTAALAVALCVPLAACGDRGGRPPEYTLTAPNTTTTTTTAPARPTATTTTTAPARPTPTTTARPEPTTTTAPPPIRVPTADDPLSVLVVGDGVMYDAEPALVAALDGTGVARVTPASILGMGLTRPEHFDFRTVWAADVAAAEPDVVLVLVGPWDVRTVPTGDGEQGPLDPGWPAFYGGLLDEATAVLTAGGAEVWWLPMLPEPPPERAPLIQAQGAAVAALDARRDDVVAPDAHAAFSAPGGGYAVGPPGADAAPWRKPDGEHLCPAGAAHVVDVVRPLLHDRFAVDLAPGWRTGPWTTDGRYTSADNGCPPLPAPA